MPEVNPSPKARFCANKDFVNAHHDLISSAAFQRGLDYALLHMLRSEDDANPQTTQDAMGRYYEHKGAQRFIRVLKTLADAERPQTKTIDRDNLATQR